MKFYADYAPVQFEHLGEYIRDRRQSRGYTQRELAGPESHSGDLAKPAAAGRAARRPGSRSLFRQFAAGRRRPQRRRPRAADFRISTAAYPMAVLSEEFHREALQLFDDFADAGDGVRLAARVPIDRASVMARMFDAERAQQR